MEAEEQRTYQTLNKEVGRNVCIVVDYGTMTNSLWMIDSRSCCASCEAEKICEPYRMYNTCIMLSCAHAKEKMEEKNRNNCSAFMHCEANI